MNYHNDKPVDLPVKGRRKFIKDSILGGISILCLPLNVNGRKPQRSKLKYDLSLDAPAKLFKDGYCWVHPRAGIVPGAGIRGLPRVVMTMSWIDLEGSDVFRATYGMQTDDLGLKWTVPEKLDPLCPRYEVIDDVERPVALSDFSPSWHKSSGVLLGTGHTVVYTPDWKVKSPRPRHTSFSTYNPADSKWSVWQKFQMPDGVKFYDSGAGSTQRYNKPDGTILLPIYYRPPDKKNSVVTVVHCSFDGRSLHYVGIGNEIYRDDETRGIGEPSITFFDGEYYLTIRHDKMGFVSRSKDGLNFSPIQPWKFDDGTDLGNYNTQQHWVTHSDGLFLVYTRRGAGNDHVFRHRAPLFMAQVDPKKMCVIRETERILVPERGARLGNFGVTDISKDETWVTVAEWMQPKGVEKYGSDGSVYVSRIHWNRPNRYFKV